MNPILVVDDNEQILNILTQYINKEGWALLTAKTGEEALSLFDAAQPALILLDIMLPGIDGLEVCRRIRRVSSVPILMITAKDEDADRILGLDIGADDYIVKPVFARRGDGRESAQSCAGFRRAKRMKRWLSAHCRFTCRRFRSRWTGISSILHAARSSCSIRLAGAPGRVFTRDNLLTMIWGYEFAGNYRAVDSHIKRLRAKLDVYPHPFFSIATVWGAGYRFERNLP